MFMSYDARYKHEDCIQTETIYHILEYNNAQFASKIHSEKK
jgi:hypothetical protein